MTPDEATNNNMVLYVLAQGQSVEKVLFDKIQARVMERLPLLNSKLLYSIKKICGEEFWKKLNRGEQKRAGLCMSEMVETNMVPMQLVLGKGRQPYPLKYQLK